MKAEEKLYLIKAILRCYHEYIDREIDHKDSMIDAIDAIDTILHFDNKEEETK